MNFYIIYQIIYRDSITKTFPVFQVESSVCGTDGVTYLNECEMRVAACNKQQYVVVGSRGPCGKFYILNFDVLNNFQQGKSRTKSGSSTTLTFLNAILFSSSLYHAPLKLSFAHCLKVSNLVKCLQVTVYFSYCNLNIHDIQIFHFIDIAF